MARSVTFDSPTPTAEQSTVSEASTLSSMASLVPCATSPKKPVAILQLMKDLQERGWTLADMQLICQLWQTASKSAIARDVSSGPQLAVDQEPQSPTSPRKRRASRSLPTAASAETSVSVQTTDSKDECAIQPIDSPKRLKAAATTVMIANSLKASHQSKRHFDTDFEFVEDGVLGRGALSVVKKVMHKRTGEHFACKCIDKSQLSLKARKSLLAETSLLRELDHPNIVRLWHYYEEPKNYFIVMDLIDGGELFDRIVAKEMYNEREARDVVRTLLDVLGYLHFERCIVHRDIKPENILCVSETDDTRIKLCDFGFAARLDTSEPHKCLTKLCGTPQYVAPEILRRKPYGAAIDMWSCGVVTYILLSGYAPFSERPNLNFNICSGNYSFCPDTWGHVSDQGKDFISQLLTLDPAERLTADEALIHPWIAEDGALLEEYDLRENLLNLRQFNVSTKFKAAAQTVIAAHRLANGTGSWTRPCEPDKVPRKSADEVAAAT